jgi:hypothetical protein
MATFMELHREPMRFWDFLGGEGCYEEILEIFDDVGKNKWPQIQKKILQSK